jgi:dolichol-phosphate mannosyltransferase
MRYSLVIPVHNEEGNILPLLEQATQVLTELGEPYEIIIVNDGSADGTAEELAIATARWPTCRVTTLAENVGQADALWVGLQAARGALILTMDGDGQNDARDFPAMIRAVEAGECDLMCGWRAHRHDAWLRRRMSRLANAVRSRWLGDGLRDAGCQLRVFRREVLTALFPFELLQAFIPAMAKAAGFRIDQMSVRHHPRLRGAAHYGLGSLWWRPAIAMIKLRARLQR